MANSGSHINLSNSLTEVFGQSLVNLLRQLNAVIHRKAGAAHLVGGMVRDVLLENASVDIDLAIQGSGRGYTFEIVNYLFHNWAAVFPDLDPPVAHEKFDAFLTAKLFFQKPLFGSSQYLDFATTRTERYAASGKRPEVQVATLAEDLWRRDFSVNAMAIDLAENNFGALLDPCGGYADIAKKQLRILHEQSFIDDPVRLIRGFRLQAKLDFEWEPQTAALAAEAIAGGYLKNVSPARRFEELKKALSEQSDAVVAVLQQHPELLLQISDVSGITPPPDTVVKPLKITATEMIWKPRLIALFSATAEESFFELLKQAAIPRTQREELVLLHRSEKAK